MSRNGEEKEPLEEEIIRELLDLRNYLEERVHTLEEEVEKLKSLFKIVDDVIVTRSFRIAESIPAAVPETSPRMVFKEEIPLKSSTGILLATMYVGDEEAKIVPPKEINYTVDIPPFQQFLITRILEPMRIKDTEASQRGEITPDQIFSYEVITEDDTIKEVVIRNFGAERRLRELISSSRWTFDKMYDKIRTSTGSMS